MMSGCRIRLDSPFQTPPLCRPALARLQPPIHPLGPLPAKPAVRCCADLGGSAVKLTCAVTSYIPTSWKPNTRRSSSPCPTSGASSVESFGGSLSLTLNVARRILHHQHWLGSRDASISLERDSRRPLFLLGEYSFTEKRSAGKRREVWVREDVFLVLCVRRQCEGRKGRRQSSSCRDQALRMNLVAYRSMCDHLLEVEGVATDELESSGAASVSAPASSSSVSSAGGVTG